ncbi:MAG: helix-hairpin-helix domain-containing protein [Deltaproteobacteria bacterium]|jgi:competence ComEA-like helix-hairpin-helix protein|nr:helix-hairpin-helix domain-containing protein [Deltaproteobacteria bacterium]
MKRCKRMKSVSTLLGLLATLAITSQLYAAKPPPSSAVNINSASIEQLMELPGIGKSKAEAIVAYRTQSKFTAKDDLLNIRGIGEKLLAKLDSYVTVSGKGAVKGSGTMVKSKKQ